MRRVLLLLAAAATGCSSGPGMAPVSGRIVVDDAPVADLRVTFSPVGSAEKPYPGPASFGYTDADGRYSLLSVKDRATGAVIGPARVRVTVAGGKADESDFGADPRKAARQLRQLPPRYNDETTLTFEVPPQGTATADFRLTWK